MTDETLETECFGGKFKVKRKITKGGGGCGRFQNPNQN